MSNTNSRFVQDINRIVRVKQGKQSNIQGTQPEPIASTRGVGEKTDLADKSSGIASPLKEIGHFREYYETELVTSSDGLFAMEVKRLKKLAFIDPNGLEVLIELDDSRVS